MNIRDELMEETSTEKLHLKPCKCPNIKIDMNGILTYALIDSGSEVTAISEEFFESNKKFRDCPKLPLNGKIVKGVLGTKSTIIKFQILCPVKIGHKIEEIIFLIIPKLGKNCIFGYDTIRDLSIIIDPDREVLHFKKAGQTIKLVEPENISNEDCNTHSLAIQCLEAEHFSLYNKENYDFFRSDNFTVAETDIDEKLKNNWNLSHSQREELKKLLWKYRKAFEKNQG